MTRYIADEEHYNEVLALCAGVKHDLWIGTADLKDLYVAFGGRPGRGGSGLGSRADSAWPFLSVIDGLLRRGVEVRLLHAKEPGENFREDFDRFKRLWGGSSSSPDAEDQPNTLQRCLCPRVHFKILVFDCSLAYIGSANLTGAGMGMKGATTRNFEAGILTDEPALVDVAADHLDSVWQGRHCKACRRKDFCGDRIGYAFGRFRMPPSTTGRRKNRSGGSLFRRVSPRRCPAAPARPTERSWPNRASAI